MRARNIKPSFFKNELLGSSDPLYGIIFQGLWCLADREGRLEDRPLRIHVEVNPYRDSASTVQALDWLVQHGFLTRYESGGDRYLAVVNFRRHQQPHVKEAASKLPPPPDQGVTSAPCEHRADTGRAALIPDSGFLIPDSGFLNADPGLHRANTVRAPGSVPHETGSDPPGDGFEAMTTIKAKYPKGAREDWATAEHHCAQLVATRQASWRELEASVERYQRSCRAVGRLPMNPANFFGAKDRPWRQDWALPERPARPESATERITRLNTGRRSTGELIAPTTSLHPPIDVTPEPVEDETHACQ